MLNYRAIVKEKKKIENGVKLIDTTYRLLIPTISNSITIDAKVLALPGIYTVYNKEDQVLVGQIDTTGDYIILGLIQKEGIFTKAAQIDIEQANITQANIDKGNIGNIGNNNIFWNK